MSSNLLKCEPTVVRSYMTTRGRQVHISGTLFKFKPFNLEFEHDAHSGKLEFKSPKFIVTSHYIYFNYAHFNATATAELIYNNEFYSRCCFGNYNVRDRNNSVMAAKLFNWAINWNTNGYHRPNSSTVSNCLICKRQFTELSLGKKQVCFGCNNFLIKTPRSRMVCIADLTIKQLKTIKIIKSRIVYDGPKSEYEI